MRIDEVITRSIRVRDPRSFKSIAARFICFGVSFWFLLLDTHVVYDPHRLAATQMGLVLIGSGQLLLDWKLFN
jgi:hypothetical protein